MLDLHDNVLLKEYVERGSEEAFATLVVRHVGRLTTWHQPVVIDGALVVRDGRQKAHAAGACHDRRVRRA